MKSTSALAIAIEENRSADPYWFPDITGWFLEGEALHLFTAVQLLRPARILEIGTFYGRSTATICSAIKTLRAPIEFTTCDLDFRSAEEFAQLFRAIHKSAEVRLPPECGEAFALGLSTLEYAHRQLDRHGLASFVQFESTDFRRIPGQFDLIFADVLHDRTEINANLAGIVDMLNDDGVLAAHDLTDEHMRMIRNASSEIRFISKRDSLGLYRVARRHRSRSRNDSSDGKKNPGARDSDVNAISEVPIVEVSMNDASLKIRRDVSATISARENHQQGLALYSSGEYHAAATVLRDALQQDATSEIANDCAAADLACGHKDKALAGFLLSVSLDPENLEAAANLGMLLASLGRARDSIPYLQKAAACAGENQREALTQLLAACKNIVAEDTLRESRGMRERVAAERERPPIPSQPAVAPTLRPPVYMGNNLALLCTTNHCKMYVDTTDLLIAPWLLIHGEWEPEETELVKKLIKPGDVFVDVGANLGYYTLLAIRVGASQVYAFEAQPSTYELLGKNVIINWMSNVVRYENLAVFSHTTDLEFFVRNSYPGNSSIGVSSPDQLAKWFDTATCVNVHAVSLDDYFADKPGKIDLLKVDVEGAEPAVFEGARRILAQNRDIKVLCEWSPDQMATAKQDPAHLIELWAEQGLRAHVLHTGLNEIPLKSLLKSGYLNLLLYR